MPIKLLSKQEIQQKQATQKKAEIDEGRKLAERVDRLRELAAHEEASLAAFRTTTLKAIKKETDAALKERDTLQKEADILRVEVAEGLKKVTTAEAGLEKKSERVAKREVQVKERLQLIEKKEGEIKVQFDQLKRFLRQVERIRDYLVRLYPLVEEDLSVAHILVADIERKKNDFEAFYDKVTAEIISKDKEVASRERDVTIKAERLEKAEHTIRKRETQLLDREQTLEREINRLKIKYGN